MDASTALCSKYTLRECRATLQRTSRDGVSELLNHGLTAVRKFLEECEKADALQTEKVGVLTWYTALFGPVEGGSLQETPLVRALFVLSLSDYLPCLHICWQLRDYQGSDSGHPSIHTTGWTTDEVLLPVSHVNRETILTALTCLAYPNQRSHQQQHRGGTHQQETACRVHLTCHRQSCGITVPCGVHKRGECE
jgi:hypothetical protein